jgi:hypothetical protein
MKIINLLTGIRFSVLFRLLKKNGITLYPKYIIRLLFILYNSFISSILTRVEKKKYGKFIAETILEKPPVFIIGHWRTGSTFLHQLFNLDRQFTTPSFVQTVIPDHFLFSTKYYVPMMKLLMPKKRSMDEVAVSPTEPQEDEFALIRMGSESPLEKLVFPPGGKFFLAGYDEYVPTGEKLTIWKQNLLTFYKKITFLTGKRIVSKNPLHTVRISVLTEIFPGARFIHIRRNPLEVVPSTLRMWNIVADCNSLRKTWKKPDITEVATVLNYFFQTVSKERQKCGEHCYAEVWFEDLEKDPLHELKRIYSELNLNYSDEFETEVIKFLAFTKNYTKNSYKLTKEEKEMIRTCMGNVMKDYSRD